MAAQFQNRFVQDLTEPLRIRQGGLVVFNADNDSNVVSVDLFVDGVPYADGGNVAGACICPDGATVALTGSLSGNNASVALTGDCFSIPGQIGVAVQVVNGTTKTTVLKVIYNVELFDTETVIDPGSRITADVGTLVNAIENATADIPASDMASLMAGIAPTFSAKTAYSAGAYVYYDGTLYRFTAAHAAGSWTGADAVACKLANDVSDLKSVSVYFKGVIPSTDDLDDYNQPGVYSWTNNNAPTHQPDQNETNQAVVLVLKGANNNVAGFAEQIVFYSSGSIYYRYRISNGWKPFEKLPNEDDITTLISTAVSQKIGFTSVIESTDDLDDYNQAGVYSWLKNNAPDNQPDSNQINSAIVLNLKGSQPNVDGYCQQIVFYSDGVAYYRYRTNTEWKPFVRIATMADIMKNVDGYDVFDFVTPTSGTTGSVHINYNGDGTWTVYGNSPSSTTPFLNIINSDSSVPDYIIPGKTYSFRIVRYNGGQAVPLRIYFYTASSQSAIRYNLKDSTQITIPKDLTGIILRFQIPLDADYGTSSNPTTIGYKMISLPDNAVSENGFVSAVDNDTAGDSSEEDESTKTDMKNAIELALNMYGHCRLGEGVFYVSGGIDMPPNSILEGCGDKTQIRLFSSVTSGYVIRPTQYCTIKSVGISGKKLDLSTTSSTTSGTRHGIAFFVGSGGSTTDNAFSIITNVFIRNFAGDGVHVVDTGVNYGRCLYMSDSYIGNCYTGIFLNKNSEFSKFSNILMIRCGNACVNNGGNNAFVNCTFHARNIGFLIDNSGNENVNNGHGILTNGTFCHIGDNKGIAIKTVNVLNGFIFEACQIHYCSIDITDSPGLIFNGFEFGKGTLPENVEHLSDKTGAVISVSGSGLVAFNNCVFMDVEHNTLHISATNGAVLRLNQCYDSSTGEPVIFS